MNLLVSGGEVHGSVGIAISCDLQWVFSREKPGWNAHLCCNLDWLDWVCESAIRAFSFSIPLDSETVSWPALKGPIAWLLWRLVRKSEARDGEMCYSSSSLVKILSVWLWNQSLYCLDWRILTHLLESIWMVLTCEHPLCSLCSVIERVICSLQQVFLSSEVHQFLFSLQIAVCFLWLASQSYL